MGLLAEGLAKTGEMVSTADGECVVRLVAHRVGAEFHGRATTFKVACQHVGGGKGMLPRIN
ncbi:hypothetical protein [Mesorhizobium intechi]|uniref:hypothetical protein n=1 Tax=Mesorhizobium intechi TaxID=537601 RepID=UPI003CCC7FEF